MGIPEEQERNLEEQEHNLGEQENAIADIQLIQHMVRIGWILDVFKGKTKRMLLVG